MSKMTSKVPVKKFVGDDDVEYIYKDRGDYGNNESMQFLSSDGENDEVLLEEFKSRKQSYIPEKTEKNNELRYLDSRLTI